MKTKSMPKLGFTLTVSTSNGGYQHLTLRIMPRTRWQDIYTDDGKPCPRFEPDRATDVEITWQANRETPREWYAGRVKINLESVDDYSTAFVHKILRILAPLHLRHGAKEVVAALETAGAVRVCYHSNMMHYVYASDWEAASKVRVFMDRGISSSGCTVHGYVTNAWTTPEDAVSKALRDYKGISDADFAKWVANGRQVEEICHGSLMGHAPIALTDLFPAKEETAQAA